MTDRPHSCRQSPNGRHRFTVSPLMCDYCARTVTYLTDMGWNAPAVDPDWVDQEADVNDARPLSPMEIAMDWKRRGF